METTRVLPRIPARPLLTRPALLCPAQAVQKHFHELPPPLVEALHDLYAQVWPPLVAKAPSPKQKSLPLPRWRSSCLTFTHLVLTAGAAAHQAELAGAAQRLLPWAAQHRTGPPRAAVATTGPLTLPASSSCPSPAMPDAAPL